MKQSCSLCDETIEEGSRHKLPHAEAKREQRQCPYCKDLGVPTCRLSETSFFYQCERCRARWTRQD